MTHAEGLWQVRLLMRRRTKTLYCFSCLKSQGIFRLMTRWLSLQNLSPHSNDKGLQGEKHQEANGAILSVRADCSVEIQDFCQPAQGENWGTWPRRWKVSQLQPRSSLMNSGREKWYQCLEKEEKAHLQRLLSDSSKQECGFGRDVYLLKIQQERGEGAGIIFKLNIRNHPKEEEQKDGICRAVQTEKPTSPRTKMLTQTHQKVIAQGCQS